MKYLGLLTGDSGGTNTRRDLHLFPGATHGHAQPQNPHPARCRPEIYPPENQKPIISFPTLWGTT